MGGGVRGAATRGARWCAHGHTRVFTVAACVLALHCMYLTAPHPHAHTCIPYARTAPHTRCRPQGLMKRFEKPTGGFFSTLFSGRK